MNLTLSGAYWETTPSASFERIALAQVSITERIAASSFVFVLVAVISLSFLQFNSPFLDLSLIRRTKGPCQDIVFGLSGLLH